MRSLRKALARFKLLDSYQHGTPDRSTFMLAQRVLIHPGAFRPYPARSPEWPTADTSALPGLSFLSF